MKNKAYFNWSGGKDSAIALYKALQENNLQIEKLLTSVNSHHKRISMHGVREGLLELQAKSIGIPLMKLYLPEQPDMDTYNQLMRKTVESIKNEGIHQTIFGDIFLEDLRKYREEQLAKVGIKAHFPIWKTDTKSLLKEFLDLGFKTIIVCVKADLLDESFAGRIIDASFFDDLPDDVDPCGENGEFHTFVFDGPIFKQPIPFKIGETIYRSYDAPKDENDSNAKMGFWFCDLLPV